MNASRLHAHVGRVNATTPPTMGTQQPSVVLPTWMIYTSLHNNFVCFHGCSIIMHVRITNTTITHNAN